MDCEISRESESHLLCLFFCCDYHTQIRHFTYIIGLVSNMARNTRMSDAYHSCYVLSGLSSAQHLWELAVSSEDKLAAAPADPVWTVLPHVDDVQVFDQKDLVRPIHPVYAIPQKSQQAMRSYFLTKEGF